jgi:aspartyl-tRNA(Asn)/glutamyl-tRNA(Gln) amidotransferase subunit A
LAGLPEREADLLGVGLVIDEELETWRSGPPEYQTGTPPD